MALYDGYTYSDPAKNPRLDGVPRPGNVDKFRDRLWGNLYDEQQIQGRRRGYYEGREAGADAESDRAYGSYRDRTDALAGESYDTPQYDGGPADPGFEGYDSYLGHAGGQYGDLDGGDLSRYGEKSFYGGDIDPNSTVGRMVARGEADLTPTDYGSLYGSYATAANDQLTRRIGDATRDLESTAAGRGRLDSTLFSRDAGTLYTGLANDTRAELSRGALSAAGLTQADRASIRSSRGQLIGSVLDTLQLNSQNARAAATAGIDRGRIAQGNREAARSGYQSDRTFSEDRFRDRRDTGRHNYEDSRDFGYGVFDDSRKFRKGVYSDQYGAAVDRSHEAYGRGEEQRGDYRDLLAGNTDRVQGDLNEQRKRKNSTIGSIIQGASTVAAAAL